MTIRHASKVLHAESARLHFLAPPGGGARVGVVGLWLGRRWAEYMTVGATAAFLPIEVVELLQRLTFAGRASRSTARVSLVGGAG